MQHRWLGSLVALVVVVAACGGADDDDASSGTAGATGELPPDQNVTAEYVITAVGDAADGGVEQDFIEFVTDDTAQRILNQFNLGPPT